MVNIDWEYLEQGKGVSRLVDELVGPRATRGEMALGLLTEIIDT
jgi:hypothetical protein